MNVLNSFVPMGVALFTVSSLLLWAMGAHGRGGLASNGVVVFAASLMAWLLGIESGFLFATGAAGVLLFAVGTGDMVFDASRPEPRPAAAETAPRSPASPPHDPVTGEILETGTRAVHPPTPLRRFERAAARHAHRPPIPNLVAQVRAGYEAIQALGPDTGLPLTEAEARKLRRVAALIDGRLGEMLERLPRSAEPTDNVLNALGAAAEDMAKLHAAAVRERVEAADIIGKHHAADRTPVEML